jgi:sulfite dehydrogenase (cytochrome) subunit B
MRPRRLALAALAVLGMGLGVTLAKPVTFTQPADTSTLKQTPADGYPKAENLCGVCHSRDYISTQPPGKGKDFWTAEVTKMVTVYGAPIVEADRATIIEYLAATY